MIYLSLSSRMYCVLLLMDYMLYTCLHRCAFSNARFKYEVARVQCELCARLLLFSSLNNLMEYLCSIFYHFACPEKPCEEQSQRSFRVFSTFFTAVLFILILLLLQTFDKWNSQTSKAPCVLHSFLEVHLDSIIS